MRFTNLLFLLAASLSLAAPVDPESQSPNDASVLEPRWDHKGHCVAKLRPSARSKHCGVPGTLAHKFAGEVHLHWTFDRCANDCVCKGETCKSFSWRPDQKNDGHGRCIQHSMHLYEMRLTVGGTGTRKFYDRTCFHRAKPSPTGVITAGPASATPVAPRSAAARDLDDALVMAMVG